MDVYGVLHLTAKDYSFFSSTLGTLIKVCDPIVHKATFNK